MTVLKPLPKTRKRYLKPSVFWSIRQGFPPALAFVLSVTALVVPLAIWAILSYGQMVPAMFLPTPVSVLTAGVKLFRDEGLMVDTIASMTRVFLGFAAAAMVGVPMGIAMGTFYSMDNLFKPIVGTVRYMPVAAFIPLIILWAGLGETARVIIIFLGIVFYNAIMVADAVKFIPNEMLSVAYTMGASRFHVLTRVILPAIVPSIIDTLRVNIAGAWNFLVLSELIAADNGLGFRIIQSQRFVQTDKVLFTIALIGLIGLLTDYAFKLVAQWVTPWAE